MNNTRIWTKPGDKAKRFGTNSEAIKRYRTNIEELSALGYELSEEHLRFASGSRPSAGSCTEPGMCDDE